MTDPQTFEARLDAALGRYADQVPAGVDAMAFVRATRRMPARRSVGWRLARPFRMALVLALVVALAILAVALVGSRPRVYADAFKPTGSMATARVHHAAALLRDGRVLIVGGTSEQGGPATVLASAEVWVPGTGRFTPSGTLAQGRWEHTATPLRDGRVLVVGGFASEDLQDAAATAELWNPDSGSFRPAGSLPAGRLWHTATLLADGRVLIIGGNQVDRSYAADAVLWDPANETFESAGRLAMGRSRHTATLLPDGSILVIGGDSAGDEPTTSAERWDPARGTFSPAGSMAVARAGHTATLLPDGRVLVVGGTTGDAAYTSAEIWDPALNAFTPVGSLAVARAGHTATVLPGGGVLIVGGDDWGFTHPRTYASSELWDPRTDSFAPTASMGEARAYHTATLLPDGRVLVIGGAGGDGDLSSAELFQ